MNRIRPYKWIVERHTNYTLQGKVPTNEDNLTYTIFIIFQFKVSFRTKTNLKVRGLDLDSVILDPYTVPTIRDVTS